MNKQMLCPNCDRPMTLTDNIYRCAACRGRYLEKLKSPHRLIIDLANELSIDLALAKNKIDIGEDSGNDVYFIEARQLITKAMGLAADIKEISRSQQGVEPVILVGGSSQSDQVGMTARDQQKYPVLEGGYSAE